jgi:hypothetical protein
MKLLTLFLLLFSFLSFAQNSDSLSYYREKVKLYESRLKSDTATGSRGPEYELKKREAAFKAEMEEQENYYKMRIDKLQTLLIAAVLSSVLVIGFVFYMLKKKKTQENK